ncbi:MAG TPA: hypothetical protein VM911_23125 [Pyrinomonadaceae bacterium]|jgi:hypothetical protein|nr:hypothetical protein [Pyrinomonadaceae bacterium]
MAAHLSLILWLWQDELNRWTQFWIGETYGIDWLWLFGGTLFIGAVGYGIYSSMLPGMISANWHPATLRKLTWALCFLLWIIWFEYVFWHAFGGLMMYFLIAVWAIAVVIFLVTGRRTSTA